MRKLTITLFLMFVGSAHGSNAIDESLKRYQDLGAGPFNEAAGERLWRSAHLPTKGEPKRSCTNCHGNDLTQEGKHLRTGKPIKPMAPTVNAERLTDRKTIEKWFKRNCKWTFGRECTPQEKGNLILYIQSRH